MKKLIGKFDLYFPILPGCIGLLPCHTVYQVVEPGKLTIWVEVTRCRRRLFVCSVCNFALIARFEGFCMVWRASIVAKGVNLSEA